MSAFEDINTSVTPAEQLAATDTQDADQSQSQQEHGNWFKRTLVAGAIAGVAFGGVEASMHSHDVEQEISHSEYSWAAAAIPITEGAAWGGAALLVGAMGRKKNIKNLMDAAKDAHAYMRRMEGDRIFQSGLRLNMLGAAGTTAAWAVGSAALPESARPAAYGIAAASIALSGIPVKISYEISKRRDAKREEQ